MFEFTESVRIEASRSRVWEVLSHVDHWWLPSNPDHIRMDVRDAGGGIRLGTEIVFEERVAGIKGHAEGHVVSWKPGHEAKWDGSAVYRYLGLRFRVRESVSWMVRGDHQLSTLSARVSARFADTIVGRCLEWYATTVLDVPERDREHARRELRYLKQRVEGGESRGR